MKQYTDSSFGFSFWYPSGWTVEQSSIDNQTYQGSNSKLYTGGNVGKSLIIRSVQNPNDGISIVEFVSSDKSITDNSNCGPVDGCGSSIQYYFDVASHTWMKKTYFDYPGGSQPLTVTAANISNNEKMSST